MKLHKLDEKSKAICPFCKEVRTTTFAERDVPLSSGKGVVRAVLVAVCDTCDRVVAIPHQSVPRVRETVRDSRHALETRIPRHLLDAVALACDKLGFDTDRTVVLFRFYVERIHQSRRLQTRLAGLAGSEEAQGRASARFSAKLSADLHARFLELEAFSNLNKAGVVRGIFVQIKHDILDKSDPPLHRELKKILAPAA